MAHAAGVSLEAAQWLLSIYVLVWGAFTLLAGVWIAQWDPKPVSLIGVTAFALGSVVVVLWDNFTLMLVGRALQGFGGALYLTATYAQIHRSIPPHQHGLAMGFFGAAVGLGLAFGPSLAGFVTHYSSWQWLFLINLPICALNMIIVGWVSKSQSSFKLDMDWRSVGLLMGSLVLGMYGLNQSMMKGLDFAIVALMVLAIAMAVFFIRRQREMKSPFLPLEIFNKGNYVACVNTFLIQQFIMSACLLLLSLCLQLVYGYTLLGAATMLSIMTLVYGFIAPIGGRWVDLMDMRVPIVVGLLLTIFGFLCLGLGLKFYGLIVALVMLGAGLGVSYASLNAAVLKVAPKEHIAIASSVFILFATIGHTMAYIVISGMLQWFSSYNVGATLTSQGVYNVAEVMANFDMLHLKEWFAQHGFQTHEIFGMLSAISKAIQKIALILLLPLGIAVIMSIRGLKEPTKSTVGLKQQGVH